MFNQNAYSNSPYGSSSSEPLAFYSGAGSSSSGNYYQGSSGDTYGSNAYGSSSMGSMGNMGNMQGGERVSGMMQSEGRWWEAFGTGGLEGEPGLLEGECGDYRVVCEGVAKRLSSMLLEHS
jgi:hypothetical protein